MADELAGLPQNIAPWFPPADHGSNAAAEDEAFRRETVPYSLLLARAGQYLPMGDLSGVAPSENIMDLRVDPFERAAARVRAPYAAAVERATASPPVQEGPFDRLRNEAQQSIADNYAQAMGVGAGDPFERAASRLKAPYAQAAQSGPHTGLTDIARYFGEQGRSVATAPLRALTGQMQVTDPVTGMPTPEAMREGQSFAGTAMTGAIPFAQRGAAGIFGGRLAKGANLTELEAAKTFAEHGVHPDDIWKSTGWFQGADAKWRHEIPDTLAQFDKGAPSEGKLPQLLTEHPLLYAAYPELRDANYQFVPGTTSSYLGRNAAGQHEFKIGDKSFSSNPSTVLHEIQHAIQDKEDFATGGTTEKGPFLTPFDAELEPLMKERIGLIKKYANPSGVEPVPLTPEENKRLNYLNKVAQTHGRLQRAYAAEALRNYQRLAGETEARNVQDRFISGATPNVHPQLSESFPRSEQIVTQYPMATGPKMVTRGQGHMPVEQFMGEAFDPFKATRSKQFLMYPEKPTFHDALLQTGHEYKVIKGADGKTYHNYTRGGGQFAGSGV